MFVKCASGQDTEVVRVSDYLGAEFVDKECLSEAQVRELIGYANKIYNVYHSNQDIEWAFDHDTKTLYILQSRPITTLDKKEETEETAEPQELKVVAKGLVASPGMGVGKVKIINDISEISRIEDGDVLVEVMTNPDMVPAMKRPTPPKSDL